MEVSSRAQAHGHALIRLLANISGADAPAPSQSLSDRLGQWIDWRHAVALSAALDARPAAPTDAAMGDDGECARVRSALVSAIDGDRAFSTGPATPGPPTGGASAAEAASAEAAFYRQRYLTLQQVMEGEIGRLRGRLRNRLAKHGGGAGRLAAIDAVMEQAVGAHERTLLAPLPEQVAAHFERLRQAAPAADAEDAATAALPPWLDRFRNDMRRLLLAELDIRLQPSLGLLAALRTPSSKAHAP